MLYTVLSYVGLALLCVLLTSYYMKPAQTSSSSSSSSFSAEKAAAFEKELSQSKKQDRSSSGKSKASKKKASSSAPAKKSAPAPPVEESESEEEVSPSVAGSNPFDALEGKKRSVTPTKKEAAPIAKKEITPVASVPETSSTSKNSDAAAKNALRREKKKKKKAAAATTPEVTETPAAFHDSKSSSPAPVTVEPNSHAVEDVVPIQHSATPSLPTLQESRVSDGSGNMGDGDESDFSPVQGRRSKKQQTKSLPPSSQVNGSLGQASQAAVTPAASSSQDLVEAETKLALLTQKLQAATDKVDQLTYTNKLLFKQLGSAHEAESRAAEELKALKAMAS
ncbi:hypothetical protein BJ684DRAFT_14312 [Piptocephalis cylindrospora]|uniref:Uncharacterized protein n=1 Tax=Piptocephalis cylindrospora TaxID=1907219 RepID=A0A4P9Y8G6_9FUNG|nr:hypothetical protein BJ684DRAFT_14312 [Piptocephalis cylindrospora]|eukprot:RKP15457.1 hypothetical protein BJ684DRAFT_14312 [Piptocephalis cylindrospora]